MVLDLFHAVLKYTSNLLLGNGLYICGRLASRVDSERCYGGKILPLPDFDHKAIP